MLAVAPSEATACNPILGVGNDEHVFLLEDRSVREDAGRLYSMLIAELIVEFCLIEIIDMRY